MIPTDASHPFGNGERNSVRSDSIHQMDLGLAKTFGPASQMGPVALPSYDPRSRTLAVGLSGRPRCPNGKTAG